AGDRRVEHRDPDQRQRPQGQRRPVPEPSAFHADIMAGGGWTGVPFRTIRQMSIDVALSAEAVASAAEHLRPIVHRTPLMRSDRLSDELGTSVWLKREDLQIGRSYQVRG